MVLYFLNNYLQRKRPPSEMVDRNIRTDYSKLRHFIRIDRMQEEGCSVITKLIDTGEVNGNVIKDIDVTVEGTITESKDGKTEVSSALNVNLNETAEGAISKLDGLKLKITAVPGQATDVQLLSTQWMQLKDMKLKIPNGIKVDLN